MRYDECYKIPQSTTTQTLQQSSSQQVSNTNLEPITDTAKAAWCHSQGCIIQSTLLNQHPNVFLFVKTPKLFECLSLWQQGNTSKQFQ